jgi:tRNA (cmo5U34)-methyltransferase
MVDTHMKEANLKRSDEDYAMIENSTISCYDDHTRLYDTYQFAVVPGYREMLDLVAEAAARYLPKQAKILDLGCGTGNASMSLLHEMPSANIFLLDGSEKMICAASEKIGNSNPGVILGSRVADLSKESWAEELDREGYDCIISTLVLEHLPFDRYNAVIGECFRLLKPGGWLFSSEGYSEEGSDMQEWFFQEMEERRIKLDPELSDFVAQLRNEKETHYYTTKAKKMEWWKDTGFQHVNVLWQYLCLALMVGQKEI